MTIETIRNAVALTRAELKDVFTFSEVYLFGSYANGQVTEDSDIDLCFVSSTWVDPWKAQVEVRKVIFDLLDTPLDLLVLNRQQFLIRAQFPSSMEHEILTTGVAI